MNNEEIKKLQDSLNSILSEYKNSISELKNKGIQLFILNDTYHDISAIIDQINFHLKIIRKSKEEILKKINSKEFQFLQENYDIRAEDLLPDKNNFKKFEDLAEFLNIKVYRAYSWDAFLFPFMEYYRAKEKIESLLYYLRERLKMINFYLKSYGKKINFNENLFQNFLKNC